jgi:hypothetical protein
VNIDLDSENGSTVQTSSLNQLPGLIGQLYEQTLHPQNSKNPSQEIQALSKILASHLPTKNTPPTFESFNP